MKNNYFAKISVVTLSMLVVAFSVLSPFVYANSIEVQNIEAPSVTAPSTEAPTVTATETTAPSIEAPEVEAPSIISSVINTVTKTFSFTKDDCECELELIKSVNKSSALPGDLIEYTITIKNIGDGDCTGGGVQIVDTLDSHLEYVSETHTSNIDGGYNGKPVFDSANGVLRWNGHTLNPNESAEIVVTAKVKNPTTCTGFTIENKAKATAKELNNFQTWEYSNKVTTTVADTCQDEPKVPTCPLDPNVAGRTIVKFGTTELRSDKLTKTAMIGTNLDAGTYEVTLVSWDGSNNRVNQTQPLEQWTAALFNGNTKVTGSNAISDLQDMVRVASLTEKVNAALVVPTAVTGVQAQHVYVGNDKTPNSVTPICAAFDKEPQPIAPECTMVADKTAITAGEKVTLTWTTTNATRAMIDQAVGIVALDGDTDVYPTSNITYTLTAANDAGEKVTCPVSITVQDDPEPKLPECPFLPQANRTIVSFGDVRLMSDRLPHESAVVNTNLTPGTYDISLASWDGYIGRENVSQPLEQWTAALLSGNSVVANTNAIVDVEDYVRQKLEQEKVNTKLTLTDTITGVQAQHVYVGKDKTPNSVQPICVAFDKEPEPEAPSCDSFFASPTSFTNGTGGDVTLTWATTNVDSVTIDQGIGAVAEDGSRVVSVANTITYTLTATKGNKTATCPVTITVTEPDVPSCDAFTATPNSFNNGTGGNVVLEWFTTNVDSVTIDQGIGAVAEDASTTVAVAKDTTFTLTATKGNTSVTCPVAVVVEEPEPKLSCDSFTVSDRTVSRGATVTLTWATTGVSEATINNGIGTVSPDGSKNVVVNGDTTYTLTIRDTKNNVRSCDVAVEVSGGGGGSSSPRCELEISKTKIKPGEEVVISWDNTRTNEMVLMDSRGNVLVDTEDDDNTYDEDEGSIKVYPTRDTEYTMTVSRGSRDRVCRVKVETEDDIVVIQEREQTPLVAGISLTQVPYTGFEAGPFMTAMFYTVLALWAAFIAYILVVREQSVLGFSLGANAKQPVTPTATPAVEEKWEAVVDQMQEAAAPVVASVATPDVPVNLPTGNFAPVANPVVGYAAYTAEPVALTTEEAAAELERVAHTHSTLLSSDAIRYFLDTYTSTTDREAALLSVIEVAKAKFPSDDGWMVLNHQRVMELSVTSVASTTPTEPVFTPTMRVGASSLAEAIVTGNVSAAYELIGSRPMFALADAAADLDALYRTRKGIEAPVSELLATESAALSNEQIEAMIAALTSALDGTYTDEAAAVKMAIMKAVKAAN